MPTRDKVLVNTNMEFCEIVLEKVEKVEIIKSVQSYSKFRVEHFFLKASDS